MKQELVEALNGWKNDNILGIKNKFIRTKKLPSGEYEIELTMKEKIYYLQESADVSETASLITFVQSGEVGELKGQPYPNPNSDLYRFNAIAATLEGHYWTKREKEMSRLIQNIRPDGFLDM